MYSRILIDKGGKIMSKKGGYKIIDLKNNDLTSSNTIEGIYDAIEGNYGKPILLSGIVIDSVEKDDIFVNVEVSGSDYVIKAYDRTITITSSDVVTSVEGGNHLYYVNVYNNITTDNDDFYINLVFYSEKLITTDNFVEYAKSNNLKLLSIWGSDISSIGGDNFTTCNVEFKDSGLYVGTNNADTYSYEDCDFSNATITTRQLF